MGWRSLQARFEESIAGRVVISAFIVITLLAVMTANLPTSRLQDLLLSAGHRYIYGTGLDQNWGVFSPDPRRVTIQVRADVTYADGSKTSWEIPRRNPVVGAYVDYRWLKWAEYVVSPEFIPTLDRPFALFVARRVSTPTHRPVRVALTNTWYDILAPGAHQPRLVHHSTFFTTQITESDLGVGAQ
jgi:hypothetical protein